MALKGEYTSHTWTLNDINQFYSFFRIMMTGKSHEGGWYLCCSGMELYGDLLLSSSEENEAKEDSSEVDPLCVTGGAISLCSDSSITNYGAITSNGTMDTYFGGFIDIQCKTFKNFGRIEAKTKGRIRIQCLSFENASDIHPEPMLIMPWQYLILDSKQNRIVLDGIPADHTKAFVTAAMNAKYQIRYLDSRSVERLVEDVNMKNLKNQKTEPTSESEDIDTALGCVPIQSNPLYSSIQVMVAPLENKSNDECSYGAYKCEKEFLLNQSRYNITQD
eukprot:1132352_1